MTRPDKITALLRALGVEITTHASRLPKALAVLNDCEGPLRASTGTGTNGGDINDPTGDYVTEQREDDATRDRRRIERIVLEQAKLTKELDGILAIWDPDPARQRQHRGGVSVTNDGLWCDNPAHGIDREPRDVNRRHCRFCDGFRRDYSVEPDSTLLDQRSRRRLNEADVQACLDRLGSNKKLKPLDA